MLSKSKNKTKSGSLISKKYSALLQEQHTIDPQWGKSAVKFKDKILKIIHQRDIESVIDYGCGKAALADYLKAAGVSATFYDPGIKKYAKHPKDSADMVICTDVLEHIEPKLLHNVLTDIAHLTKQIAFMVIYTGDCGHRLPDGSPAHLIQMPRAWWEGQIIEVFGEYFDFTFKPAGYPNRFVCVAKRRVQPMTAEEKAKREEYVEGLQDPEPDLSAIDKVDLPTGGFANFGKISKYQEG